MQKALSIEMKHGRELVIIGLVAMQGCSYLKSQGSGEPWRPTIMENIQLRRVINAYKTKKTAQSSILRLSSASDQSSRQCVHN